MTAPRTKHRQTALALLALLITGLQGAGAVAAPAGPVAAAPPAAELSGDSSDLLAVVGRGPGALRVTRADFDRAFRAAVDEVLGAGPVGER